MLTRSLVLNYNYLEKIVLVLLVPRVLLHTATSVIDKVEIQYCDINLPQRKTLKYCIEEINEFK